MREKAKSAGWTRKRVPETTIKSVPGRTPLRALNMWPTKHEDYARFNDWNNRDQRGYEH